MVVPIVEVTGPTFARITEGMTVIPYQRHVVESSGRYVACDLKYGEISPMVQKGFAIDSALDDALPDSKLVVFHVLPSMHDYFELFGYECGFAHFDVNKMDRERISRYWWRKRGVIWLHRELMRKFKMTCDWCMIENENLREWGCPANESGRACKNGNREQLYTEDIPF